MSTPHIQKVKEELINLFKENKYDTTTVSFGQKRVGTNYTEEKAICFGVREKLSVEKIPSDKLIPPTITIDGVEYKTDVQASAGEYFSLKLMGQMLYEQNQKAIDIASTNFQPQSVNVSVNAISEYALTNTGSTYAVGVSQPFTNCILYKAGNNTLTDQSFSVYFCHQTSSILTIPAAYGGYVYFSADASWTPPTHTIEGALIDGANVILAVDPLKQGSSYVENFWYCCSVGQNEYAVGPINQKNADSRISTIRSKNRPLRGGLSIGPKATNVGGNNYNISVGTLGGIVTDTKDGKMVGITNNHVAAEPTIPGGHPKYLAGDPNVLTDYANYSIIDNYQPSVYDSAQVNAGSHLLGNLKRNYPFTSTGINYIDAALINLNGLSVDTDSWNVIGSPFSAPTPFASTAEIDAITTSTEIFKCGRTTGPVGMNINDFVANNPCRLIVTSTSAVSYVGYDRAILFADLIKLAPVYPSNIITGLAGDSGSLVYAKIGGVWKIIGLFFAGNFKSGTYTEFINGTAYSYPEGLACRIDRVASMLKVDAYMGGTVNADPNTPTYTKLDGATYGNQASVEIGGKTYWQVGIYTGGTYPPYGAYVAASTGREIFP